MNRKQRLLILRKGYNGHNYQVIHDDIFENICEPAILQTKLCPQQNLSRRAAERGSEVIVITQASISE